MRGSEKRDFLQLYINGSKHVVSGEMAFWTLSDFLRQSLGLVGTKIVCSEGDCGACSVLVGKPSADGNSLTYRVIDSCIAFLYQLDCTHVVSVEGLGDEKNLSAVQQAMVDCHGSQCGFCTPGFVTTLHGLVEANNSCDLSEDTLRVGLSGNLCRCTGYVQIIEAAQSLGDEHLTPINEVYPPQPICKSLNERLGDSVAVESANRTVYVPRNWGDVLQIKKEHPGARPVSGATDVGVQYNHGRRRDAKLLCLAHVDELSDIVVEDKKVVVGAGATWTQLLELLEGLFSEAVEVLSRFGSPQIRNMGTIGGNLANASPIADCIPFLYAMEATLLLEDATGQRTLPIADFYLGYKKLDLRESELIRSIEIPRLASNERLFLEKVSRRRDMDISTFTAAMRIGLDGDSIGSATVALGGVGPTVLRIPKAEDRLRGAKLTLDTMQAAGLAARDSIQPLSDVRGSDGYRWQLAENVFLKWFHELSDSLKTETATQ